MLDKPGLTCSPNGCEPERPGPNADFCTRQALPLFFHPYMNRHILSIATALLLLTPPIYADRAIWNLDATSGDWNKAANWTPASVPNGPIDVAIFTMSSTFTLGPTAATEVNSIIFADERLFVIQPTTGSLTISGAGIINNNSITQSFVSSSDSGPIIFTNNAKAGTHVAFTASGGNPGGRIQFTGNADAAASIFENFGGGTDAGSNGMTEFFDNSTAASATFTNYRGVYSFDLGGLTIFHDTSTAANAIFINMVGAGGAFPGEVDFLDASTAADATFANGGYIKFEDSSTAANAVMTQGDNVGNFGFTFFYGNSTAGNAAITILNGGLRFSDESSAGSSTIIGDYTGGGPSVTFDPGTTLDHATLISNGSSYSINSTAGSGNIIINAPGGVYCNDADSCTLTVNGAASDIFGGAAAFRRQYRQQYADRERRHRSGQECRWLIGVRRISQRQ